VGHFEAPLVGFSLATRELAHERSQVLLFVQSRPKRLEANHEPSRGQLEMQKERQPLEITRSLMR
jgi:hypothetical protein